VIELLAREGGCLDAQAVFDRLREQGRRVGMATVYRTLDLLAEQALRSGSTSAQGRPATSRCFLAAATTIWSARAAAGSRSSPVARSMTS